MTTPDASARHGDPGQRIDVAPAPRHRRSEPMVRNLGLEGFLDCTRCGVRSQEVWANEDESLILPLCQHHADKHGVAMWQQGFRPIAKARVEVKQTADA